MLTALTILHIAVCFFLIIVVLLQSGKAADLAGAFGGMGSQTAFGARGAATLLSKATTTAAVLFMLTSIGLGIWEGRTLGAGESVIERTGVEGEAGGATPTPAGAVRDLPIPPPPTSSGAAGGAVGLEAEGEVEVQGPADAPPSTPQE